MGKSTGTRGNRGAVLERGSRVRGLKAHFGVQDGRREHYVYEKSFTNRTKAFLSLKEGRHSRSVALKPRK